MSTILSKTKSVRFGSPSIPGGPQKTIGPITYNIITDSSSTSFISSSSSFSINTMPSSLRIKFRNIFGILTPSHRASSEPLPTNSDIDTATPPTVNLPRSQSESHLPLSEDPTLTDQSSINKPSTEQVINTMQDETSLSHPPCPPSPAATEVDDPESQDIMNQIQIKGIKIQDFAYPSLTSPAPHLSPVPEMFDPYKGIAEVDYRWTQSHRTYPIQGKTLSRLIELGWIGQEELSARAAPMDLEELRKHNARQPMYPWKPFRWTTIPTADERREWLHSRASYLHQWDRIRADAEFQEMRRLKLERETEEVEEKMREREREREQALAQSQAKGKGKQVETSARKRRLEMDDEDCNSMNTLSDGESDILEDGTDPKKRRLSEEPENLYPAFLIPSKQYPAPLHTYDPEIYPEAAYAIGSSSQSQPRPVVPRRTDTPPLSDDDDTKRPPGRGTKLVHPKKGKALKRQLSRTQTYTQL